MERPTGIQQPLLPRGAAWTHPTLPVLRACLLSGGESRRMGRDKALLPHPEGGTWLERTLRLLARLEVPITLLSRHPRHLELAQLLARESALPELETIAEPPPWQGPLLALHRLMERHPQQRLLLCPVDMPGLQLQALLSLCAAATSAPERIQIAHDGSRPQPLLALLPADDALRRQLAATVSGGERRLQSWIEQQSHQCVRLDVRSIRNINRPEDWRAATQDACTESPAARPGGSAPA